MYASISTAMPMVSQEKKPEMPSGAKTVGMLSAPAPICELITRASNEKKPKTGVLVCVFLDIMTL